MKKIFYVFLICMMFVCGCSGLNTSTVVNVASDMTFVMFLQNNPDYKADVVSGLENIKTFLNGEVTYDDLVLEIAKQLPDKYKAVAVVLTSYIDADKPVFETYVTLLDSYKAGVISKIDRLIALASI